MIAELVASLFPATTQYAGRKSFQSSISKEGARISLKKYRKIPRMRHGSKPEA